MGACALWMLQNLTRLGLAREHRTCRRLRLRAWPRAPHGLNWPVELGPESRLARNGRSKWPLGLAGALEMATRARSAPPGRPKRPLEPARFRWGARNGRSSRLSSARPGLENIAPADVCDIKLHKTLYFMSLCFLRHIMHTYDIRQTQMMILLTSGESELS